VLRFALRYVLLGLLMMPPAVYGQDAPGRQRLILKDGTYQVVLRYEVKGGLVRFRSAERGDWEEVPVNLVDWDATAHWNHDHAPGAPPVAGDPGAQEAAELDREAVAARTEEASRQPIIAPGLRLPDESGVWGLDSWNGTPELVRVRQSDGDLNLNLGHSVKGAAIPTGGARDLIRLDGYKAVVAFHVARPVFFIALDTPQGPAPAREDAMVVDTHGASSAAVADKTQQASPDSSYALVRLRVWKGERTAAGEQLKNLSTGGDADGSAEVIATAKDVLPGGHWMRVQPRSDLNLGQYTLIEILPGSGFNRDGWDFGVNPMAPENKGSFQPLATGAP
jgi:hypothetical protein